MYINFIYMLSFIVVNAIFWAIADGHLSPDEQTSERIQKKVNEFMEEIKLMFKLNSVDLDKKNDVDYLRGYSGYDFDDLGDDDLSDEYAEFVEDNYVKFKKERRRVIQRRQNAIDDLDYDSLYKKEED